MRKSVCVHRLMSIEILGIRFNCNAMPKNAQRMSPNQQRCELCTMHYRQLYWNFQCLHCCCCVRQPLDTYLVPAVCRLFSNSITKEQIHSFMCSMLATVPTSNGTRTSLIFRLFDHLLLSLHSRICVVQVCVCAWLRSTCVQEPVRQYHRDFRAG